MGCFYAYEPMPLCTKCRYSALQYRNVLCYQCKLLRLQKHTSSLGKQHKNKPFMAECSIVGENCRKPSKCLSGQEKSTLFQMKNFILPTIKLLYKAQLSLSVHLLLVKLNY